MTDNIEQFKQEKRKRRVKKGLMIVMEIPI
jgi:hypothetical protein